MEDAGAAAVTPAAATASTTAAPQDGGSQHSEEDEEDEMHDELLPQQFSTSNEISRLPASVVRTLVGGTAISDLASAVKELVDNALDAGACTVNVRLFDSGLNIIEVSDDGTGIPVSSRPFVCLPHATSKLGGDLASEFTNATPRTLGFRGEALHSFVSTSRQVIIATRTSEEEMATKLTFLRDGNLDEPNSREQFPKKIGTTVAVVGFLENLPVRRKHLISRIKQERSRLVKLMEAYACVVRRNSAYVFWIMKALVCRQALTILLLFSCFVVLRHSQNL